MPRDFVAVAMGAAISFLAGCADFATPVTVPAPKPEHEGIEPSQIGVACAYEILWVFSYGDSHIVKAKKNGGIVDIATVEILEKVFLVNAFPFNFYRRQCTEVRAYS